MSENPTNPDISINDLKKCYNNPEFYDAYSRALDLVSQNFILNKNEHTFNELMHINEILANIFTPTYEEDFEINCTSIDTFIQQVKDFNEKEGVELEALVNRMREIVQESKSSAEIETE